MSKAICGVLFVASGLSLFRWWNTRLKSGVWAPPIPPGAEVYGAFFLFSATVNPWYLLWLAPFVALRPWSAGIAAMALVSLSYITGLNLGQSNLDNFEHPDWVRGVEYGGIALAGAVEVWRRLRPNPSSQPAISAKA